jgi:hypothetical protein
METKLPLTFVHTVTVVLEYCECGCKTTRVLEKNAAGRNLRINGSILMYSKDKNVTVKLYSLPCGAGSLVKEGSARDWDEAHDLAHTMVAHRYSESGYEQIVPPFADMGAGI